MNARLPSDENAQIAQWLRQAAEIPQAQGANPFRVAAYRKAADTVEQFGGNLRELLAMKGRAGLDALPGVGAGIAAAIAEMLATGHWSRLERLRGNLEPTALFRTVPGIGPELAQRIHDALGIETLEALEIACHDGRLGAIPGIGARRAAAIRAALAELLGRSRLRAPVSKHAGSEPSVSLLLDVDREYAEKARAGALPTIAPRRFNPDHQAWLPVLHTTRGRWHFTALYSNTATAHQLGRTRDWVVLYFYGDDHAELQRTVVTESGGALRGRRVVRGREAECGAFYALEEGVASVPERSNPVNAAPKPAARTTGRLIGNPPRTRTCARKAVRQRLFDIGLRTKCSVTPAPSPAVTSMSRSPPVSRLRRKLPATATRSTPGAPWRRALSTSVGMRARKSQIGKRP